ncbi:methyltransferase domain-containing protein [Longispora urticae]
MNTADSQARSWGTRPTDWADVQEPKIRPVTRAVLEELGPWRGRSLLDVGCGAGEFAGTAAGHGAAVSGLDVAAPLIDLARARHPTGEFRVGTMELLPYPDDAFDIVTAFNCLHFSAHPERTVTEAIRVLRTGGDFVIATWGPPTECDAVTYLLELGALLPPPERPATHLDPSDVEAFRRLLSGTGLRPSAWRVVPCPWEYPDLATALRGLLSTGPAAEAIGHSGHRSVAAAVAGSIAPYRRDDGSYLLRNTCYYLVANVGKGPTA